MLNNFNKTIEYYQYAIQTPNTKRIDEIIESDEYRQKPNEERVFKKVLSKQVDEYNDIKLKKQKEATQIYDDEMRRQAWYKTRKRLEEKVEEARKSKLEQKIKENKAIKHYKEKMEKIKDLKDELLSKQIEGQKEIRENYEK